MLIHTKDKGYIDHTVASKEEMLIAFEKVERNWNDQIKASYFLKDYIFALEAENMRLNHILSMEVLAKNGIEKVE